VFPTSNLLMAFAQGRLYKAEGSYMSNISKNTTAARRRQISLVAAALIAGVGGTVWATYDAFLLASLVAAAGLIWSSREWKAWAIAAPMVAAGLLWSSLDPGGCSVGSKARAVYEKLAGHTPYVEWNDIARAMTCPCIASPQRQMAAVGPVQALEEKVLDGQKVERVRTKLGDFWIRSSERELLTWLLWEMTVQQDYSDGDTTVHAGDTVFDCGAHVGVFTRYALRHGAARVIAVEPEPMNVALLEANFAPEIASGQVKIVKAGVWDQDTVLTLDRTDGNSAQNSFVRTDRSGTELPGIRVLPLDEIVDQFHLDRVDFIKMDIEGAERHALEGARKTMARFKPRMAICTYHLTDDPMVVPAIVKKVQPPYHVYAKNIEVAPTQFITKVMFFE
jgi:FkbM family methyltransferase